MSEKLVFKEDEGKQVIELYGKKEDLIRECLDLYNTVTTEMHESGESLPFPGIRPELVENMRKEEEEFPGYVTPVDELIERFTAEGMRLELGWDDPNGVNIVAVPYESIINTKNDSNKDSILISKLLSDNVPDEKLRKLILLKNFLQ